jgi:Flp pilus assembly protein TadD
MALGQIKAQMGQTAEAEAMFRKALKVSNVRG